MKRFTIKKTVLDFIFYFNQTQTLEKILLSVNMDFNISIRKKSLKFPLISILRTFLIPLNKNMKARKNRSNFYTKLIFILQI